MTMMQATRNFTMRDVPETGLPVEYPAIESLPEFFGVIEGLNAACRNFNGSICHCRGETIMAYRSEAYSAINTVWMARLNGEFAPISTVQVRIPDEPGVHYEDPRIAMIGGMLHLMVAHVKFGIPNTCRQRLFILAEDFQPVQEIPLSYGNMDEGSVEKNWCPFEMPNGQLGIVYTQRPHFVIEYTTGNGYQTPGAKEWIFGNSMNGRTPPLRIEENYYLSFFGGHVKHDFRGTRYFMGAQLFNARMPFDVRHATKRPLVWGSEFSPTTLSARPNSGHPCCIFPAGIIRHGDDVILSCGVNDSYIVLLRYSLGDLINKMSQVDERGMFY